MPLAFHPIPTETARAYRTGAPDAYGNPPERIICDSPGNPCRHCLTHITPGGEMLVLAHSPFGARQPYAETGPIFLCAEDCAAHDPSSGVPLIYQDRAMLVRAYGPNERILYGTGAVAPAGDLASECAARLASRAVAFVHVRSSTNNCYHMRVERTDQSVTPGLAPARAIAHIRRQ